MTSPASPPEPKRAIAFIDGQNLYLKVDPILWTTNEASEDRGGTLCIFGSEGTALEPFFLGDLFTLAGGLGAAE
jgi:hypothetical protein